MTFEELLAATKTGNDPDAFWKLGNYYLNEENYTDAANNFNKAVEFDCTEGFYGIGKVLYEVYEEEDADDEEYVKVFSIYYKAAERGYGLAIFEVAECYYYGIGVEEDEEEALKYYKKAVDAITQALSGVINGYEDDFTEWVSALNKSLYILGSFYYDGEIVEEDTEKAFSYFKKAAQNKFGKAAYRVANMYSNGIGVEEAPVAAISWYKKAIKFLKEENEYDDVEEYLEKATSELEELQAVVGEVVSSMSNIASSNKSATPKKTPAKSPEKAFSKDYRFGVLFPTTYGNTRFESMEDVKSQIKSNYDALGFFSQCSLFGAGTKKTGENAIDGLFEAANGECSDAILMIGRLYEYGQSFIRKNINQALAIYKYAYSLQNIDALHSMGFLYYNYLGKKEIGISMMKKSAELGSRGAKFHLQLLEENIKNIPEMDFDDIPADTFVFSLPEAMKGISLYGVDLSNHDAIKGALLETMNHMKPQTFSVIMNEFRMQYLRGRELSHFENIDFRSVFDELLNDGAIETINVESFSITEGTLYKSKESTEKIKVIVLEGDDWD